MFFAVALDLRLNQETVLLDWVPPNVDKELVRLLNTCAKMF